jgi:ribosomal-protein-alanine N-acetyltransferase
MPTIALLTERLLLRDFVEADWRAVHLYGSDPDVVRFMPWGPNSEEDTKAFVARALSAQADSPRTKHELAVVLREEGRLIGGCGIRVSGPADRRADMGYCLHSGFWGKGYATEVAEALLAFGFDRLALHRIIATCDVGNAASARVLEKVGMRREAYFREDSWIRGVWRDSYLYAVLEDEWRTGHEGG